MNKKLLEDFGINVNQVLNFWGDIDSYNESLKEFKNSLDDKLKNLKYYMNSNDWNNYAILAHSLKSEAKYLGFESEAEIFLEHELKGKENQKDFILNNFFYLENAINSIINLLNHYFNSNKKKKILIADDSNIIINYIENNIGDDFQVIKANTGKEAIERVNADIYAILLDLNMPGLDGFGVLEHLKTEDLLDSIPVVVITGDDTESTIKKAFTYQILDVLNKPFKDENIRRVLSSIKSFYDNK